jgi:hypothetical protein
MMVLVILPIEWFVCAQDHTSLARRDVDIMVASGGMNLYCDL